MQSYTHKERILQLLREAGDKGVHSFTLAYEVSFRSSARIHELIQEGYNITATREKKGKSLGSRYFIKS